MLFGIFSGSYLVVGMLKGQRFLGRWQTFYISLASMAALAPTCCLTPIRDPGERERLAEAKEKKPLHIQSIRHKSHMYF